MTPQFALDLSEDGIVLLHRLPDNAGWLEVGTAALDGSDLTAALARLRDRAEELEGPGFTTKLILPPSQLLYATVTVDGDPDAGVREALEEKTPYKATELRYDTSGTPPEVQVVAVARETLVEAESFIGAHGFNPVGFTAVPEAGHFKGEPNLGGMPSAAGSGFTADKSPVRVVSAKDAAKLKAAVPEEKPVAKPVIETPAKKEAEAEPAPAAKTEADAKPESFATPVAEPEPAAKADATPVSKPEVEPVSKPEPPAAAAPVAKAPPEPVAATKEKPTPVVAKTPGQTPPPPAAFSSRRRPTPGLEGDTGDLVTARQPRIGVPSPDPAPEAPPKPAQKVEPRIKTGKLAKSKPVPAIVPPPMPTAAKAQKPAAPPRKTKAPSRMSQGLASLRARSKSKPVTPAPAPAPAGPMRDPIAELAAQQAAGKPRFLGLILTAILLVALLLFAALSSYLLPEDAVARLLGRDPEPEAVASAPLEPMPEEQGFALEATDVSVPSPEELAEGVVPEPLIDEADAENELALLAAPPAEPQTELPAQMSATDAETAYAVSGIWQLAPDLSAGDVDGTLEDLYESSLDPDPAFEDAPALTSFDEASALLDVTPPEAPPAASILFSLDERGLAVPSAEGTLNPDGILVFSGPPPVAAIQRPDGLVPEAAEADTDTATDTTIEDDQTQSEVEGETSAPDSRLAAIRPNQRPGDLQELFERANLGGLTSTELAGIRPQQRPAEAPNAARQEAIAEALAEAAEAEATRAAQAELDRPTAQAVARSLRPDTRPRNFERVVAVARAAAAPRQTRQTASTAAVARATGPAVVRNSRAAPTGPTRASVARAATDTNAIALGKVALVGVFGTSSNRRALVRMPNGRFKKVGVGDNVDGGRVAAIGEGELRYTKGGRTLKLEMPRG